MALSRFSASRAPALRSSKRYSSRWHFISVAVSIVFLFFAGHVQVFHWSDGLSSAGLGARLKDRNSNGSGILIPRQTYPGILGGDTDSPSWSERLNTGNMLWCLMQNPAAEQSEWTEDDLGDYGYIYGVDAEDDVQSFRNHITPLYGKGDGALGLGTTNEVSQMYAQLLLWEDEDGNEVVPSLGFFKNIVNGPEGYIIAGSNTSPESSDVRVVPALSKWSDIVAIQWTSFAGQNPAPLGLVIQSSVRNANTLAIIQRAFITIGQATVPLWPGIDFERTDRSTPQQAQAFTGLLGSYHGAGPAYMLAQHQMLFGQRMITRIRIWAETTPWDVATGSIVDFEANMVLFVDDVPA